MGLWTWVLHFSALGLAIEANNIVVSLNDHISCTTERNEEGICVYQYQCRDGILSQYGEGIIDVRQALDDCGDYMMRCCKDPFLTVTSPSIEASSGNPNITDDDQIIDQSTNPTIADEAKSTEKMLTGMATTEANNEGRNKTDDMAISPGGASAENVNITSTTAANDEGRNGTHKTKPSPGGASTDNWNITSTTAANDEGRNGTDKTKPSPGGASTANWNVTNGNVAMTTPNVPSIIHGNNATVQTGPKPSRPPIVQIPAYDKEGCGHRNPEGVVFTIENNVNSESEYGEYPWAVAIFTRTEDNSLKYRCGGALIDPAAILTTASCLYEHKSKTSQLVIRLGEWDMSTDREPIPHVDRGVERVHLHPDYRMTSKVHDIAIVILQDTIELGHTIDVVCLPPANHNPLYSIVGTGWGDVPSFVLPKKLPQTILKESYLSYFPHKLCQTVLRQRMRKSYTLHESFLCAMAIDTEMLACKGDIGSPYVMEIKGGSNRYYLVGLSSWGFDCNRQSLPTVLTNVAFHREWIDRVIKNEHLNSWSYTYNSEIDFSDESK